jgi:hypothetical protein
MQSIHGGLKAFLSGFGHLCKRAATDPLQQALAELQPNHLPNPVIWWPPGPAWWIAGLLTITLITSALVLFYRYYQRNRYRSAALQESAKIVAAYFSWSLGESRAVACLIKKQEPVIAMKCGHLFSREGGKGNSLQQAVEILDPPLASIAVNEQKKIIFFPILGGRAPGTPLLASYNN